MRKLRPWSHAQLLARHLIAEAAEHHDDLHPIECLHLSGEEWSAGVPLARCRLVGRRSTFHRRGDPGVLHLQSVIERRRVGLRCVARPPERTIEPITGSIAREHAACAVRPVSCRGEPDNQQMRIGITKPRHAPGPIRVVSVGGSFLLTDLFAPFDEARTLAAVRHVVSENR